MKFLIDTFTENGYDSSLLQKLITEYKNKKNNMSDNKNDKNSNIVTLPWVPILGPRLSKVYRKAGIKVVFKSNSNLKMDRTGYKNIKRNIYWFCRSSI